MEILRILLNCLRVAIESINQSSVVLINYLRFRAWRRRREWNLIFFLPPLPPPSIPRSRLQIAPHSFNDFLNFFVFPAATVIRASYANSLHSRESFAETCNVICFYALKRFCTRVQFAIKLFILQERDEGGGWRVKGGGDWKLWKLKKFAQSLREIT